MKQKKNWQNKNVLMPYVVLLGIVLCLEIFIFNFSTWKTLGCEEIVMAENVVTDETGHFSTEYIEVYRDVKNVYVELDTIRYDKAQVVVSLTDEGDYYAYDMPAYTVVPGVSGSGYQNIYPFGEVNTIKVTIMVPEGTVAEIDSIALNVVCPFDFKVLRVLGLFVVLAGGYLLMSDCEIAKVECKRKNKWQFAVILCTILALAVLAGMFVRSNPVCVNSPWSHHKQYQELAHALDNGTVVLGAQPDVGLLEKENPYDTIALQAEGISYWADYAFFDGKYYSYFGIIPELLLFYPYYRLMNEDMQNYEVVFLFYSAMLVGVFGTLWEVVHRYAKRVPFLMYLLMALSVSLLSNYVFMLGRPDIYNIPIMAGNTFLWLGSFCWLRMLNVEKNRWLWCGMGALSMACIMGCRPQMILYGIVIFAVLLMPSIWRQKKKWKKYGKEIAVFLLPFAVIGGIVFWYNYARFGSGFDFGATYSLTSNDMNHRGFNFSRIFRGLYNFLFQPPVINAEFPFLDSAELDTNYMGKNIVEFTYGGIFAIYPLLLSLAYVIVGGFKVLEKEQKWFVASMGVTSLVVAAFDINAAGILQRYMGDMVIGFSLAAVIVIFVLLDRYADSNVSKWLKKGIYGCTIWGLAFSFLVWICSGNSICLENYNPQLFYSVAEYFKF